MTLFHSTQPWLSLVVSFALSGGIALAAVRARALTRAGGLAACVVGGTILGFGGWLWGGVLLTFFVTSTGLGKALGKRRPTFAGRSDTHYVTPEKSGHRDAWQVLANGGAAALCALAYGLSFWHTRHSEAIYFVGFVAAMATANGDTWATEVGSVLGSQPRMITTWRRVNPGMSGAITSLGTLAAALGAGLIALFSSGLGVKIVVTIWACGLFGVILDSLLGATMQAQWKDSQTGTFTEKLRVGVQPDRGFAWLRNDLVNFLSIICSCLLAICLYSKI